MICPNCGGWVDEGEPMCSCGTSFGEDYQQEYTCPECGEQFANIRKLYDEFEDSFDDLLAEHMSNNPEKAHLIDPDELRYLVNDNQRLPA